MAFSTVFVLGVISIAHIVNVQGGGIVQMHLRSFQNFAGTVTNVNGRKDCCDSINTPPNCDPKRCDPVIDICMSEKGPVMPGTCNQMHVRLPTYLDTDAINFNNLFKQFTFDYWGGSLFVSVTVSDGGGGFNKMVQTSETLFVSTPVMHNDSDWRLLNISKDGMSVVMEVNIKCAENFRNLHCDCQDVDKPSEHTMCDRRGTRVCLKGWANLPKCLTQTVDCQTSNPCINGACGTYTNNVTNNDVIVCTCPLDYTGHLCDIYTGQTTNPPATTVPNVKSTTTAATTTATTITTTTTPTLTSGSITAMPSTAQPSVTTNAKPSAQTSNIPLGSNNSGPTTTMPPTTTTQPRVTTNAKPSGQTSNIPMGSNNTKPNSGNNRKSQGSASGSSSTGAIGGAVGGVAAVAGIIAAMLLRKRIWKACRNDVADAGNATENQTQSPSDKPNKEEKTNGDVNNETEEEQGNVRVVEVGNEC